MEEVGVVNCFGCLRDVFGVVVFTRTSGDRVDVPNMFLRITKQRDYCTANFKTPRKHVQIGKDRGEPWIMDYGISTFHGEFLLKNESLSRVTSTPTLPGTFKFFSYV